MMHSHYARRAVAFGFSVLLVFASLFGASAQQRRAHERSGVQPRSVQSSIQKANAAPQVRTRLVLLIVVDQFRYDYLERFNDLFAPNGIKRLMRDGASWTETNYDHMPTYTAPGHATLMTGAWPAETGIVANDWPDRDTGKSVSSVSDTTATLFGGEQGEVASSPRRLMASTLGDELRLRTNDRSKVIGISVKDRSAILPAGRHANAAYWFSQRTGRMVSSNYYFNNLPAWVESFNDARPADKFYGARWERLLPESEYLKRAGADAPPWENIGNAPGDTNTFPHTITGGVASPNSNFYGALDYTPFSNDLLLAFAEQAITNEKLGADDDVDILTVSFSANDYVGHRYGPYSQEVMDITLRVDRSIAALLDFVQKQVGLQNTLVVFTADHGVAPIPEHANALGLPGGRVKSDDVLRAMKLGISARYNRKNEQPDPTADYVQKFGEREGFFNDNLYFNPVALKRDGINNEEIERVACNAAMTVPGISRCFTRTQLEYGAISFGDSVARRVSHGFYPRRSGDVVVVHEPFKYLGDTIPATHGSPYSYDTHVPLLMMGSGVAPGRYMQAATPADIAPTLASILGIQAPSNTVGRVLIEGIITTRK
ncbi:MAG TPA: alkaline phosphatase family protein [Pyrinomonadaceae bacterium]|jgi:predicted AlkP superfamily pyrophosphatase or phosphodiesterase|nr:alkaline phosphatase family protein [Pyrinomonadaceae bacterium]